MIASKQRSLKDGDQRKRRKDFLHYYWSKFSLGLLIDMLIDHLLTINMGQDIHEL